MSTTTTTAPLTREEWRAHALAFTRAVLITCCGKRENDQWKPAPDTGARAALRAGVRKPVEAFPVAADRVIFGIAQRHGPEIACAAWTNNEVEPERMRAYYTVAALIADQARDARDQQANGEAEENVDSLGISLATLDKHQPYDIETPRESDLRLMAKQSLEGIHTLLPDVIRHLRAGEGPVPVGWAQLIMDLSAWTDRRNEITKRWNQDYYRRRYANGRALSTAAQPTDDSQESEND